MKYKKIKEGIFLSRPNRFIAQVLVDGKEESVHVKNTGRCRELLTDHARVILEEGTNPGRKTKYSLIAVYKKDRLINMDSQAPNAVAEEGLRKGLYKEIGFVEEIRREVCFHDSRFDIFYKKNGRQGFVEVKGVTLEEDGHAFFPDAPTQRGRKHLKELIQAKQEGYEASVLFLIQMEQMQYFSPNTVTDPAFAETLKQAWKEGVHILVYDCFVTEDELTASGRQIPLIF
ncbi:MAG: DNA/RNA nuclease SfsA [Clostridiales bacterium]|nr:DNA/RNA nuclease SfsA [Clostridiales bacterium]